MAKNVEYQLSSWDRIPATSPAPGIERRMMVGEQVMICRLRFDPHTVTPVHTHPHEQMTIVERGRVKFYIGPEAHIVGPGDVLHFPSNVEHGATMLDEEVVLMDIFTPIREDFLK
jgi:quercetin dioxygenase-like cupin family protein